jgi:hypothetical protein
MITLPEALAPAFAAALALQHLTELIDSFLNRSQAAAKKKLTIGICSLIVACVLIGFVPTLGILDNIHRAAATVTSTTGQAVANPPAQPPARPEQRDWLDLFISALIVSAGTDGFNSILKFLTYKKDETKVEAGQAAAVGTGDPAAALTLPQPQLT